MRGAFHRTVTVWSLPEFLEPELEDWVVVCGARWPGGANCPVQFEQLPSAVRRLAWEADQARWRPGGPARQAERVLFTARCREALTALGFCEAQPWVSERY